MNIKYQCTQCGNADEIEAQVSETGIATLPECPNCGKQLMFGLDVTGGDLYETTFGETSGHFVFPPSETPDSDIYLKSPFTDAQVRQLMRLEEDFRKEIQRATEDYEAARDALANQFLEENGKK